MIQSIAIQAYFDQMRAFFTRQGFDPTTKVVYSADAEGPQKLLEQDIASKPQESSSGGVRDAYTYLFWTKDALKNINRRSYNLRDGVTSTGANQYKKTVAASFGMGCVLVSNKAVLIEDFSEAFAAEFQNVHGIPINLKFAYDTRTAVDAGGFDTRGLHATIIQELGREELISFKVGNLFSYAWNVTIHLNFVSEFAAMKLVPLQSVVVDLYNTKGIPLVSMDMAGQPVLIEHEAPDSTAVTVPEKPLYSRDV